MDKDLLDRIASVAHDLWRRNLERQGWRLGPVFNGEQRIHDAMVPYSNLSPFDQREVRIGVECLELDRGLLRSVEHVHGPSREFPWRRCERACPDGDLAEYHPSQRELRRIE
jgi:hypothetical protein